MNSRGEESGGGRFGGFFGVKTKPLLEDPRGLGGPQDWDFPMIQLVVVICFPCYVYYMKHNTAFLVPAGQRSGEVYESEQCVICDEERRLKNVPLLLTSVSGRLVFRNNSQLVRNSPTTVYSKQFTNHSVCN